MDFRYKMGQAVELLDIQNAMSVVDSFIRDVQAKEKSRGYVVHKIISAAGEMFMDMIKNMRFNVEIPAKVYEEFKTRLRLGISLDQLFEALRRLIHTLINFIIMEKKEAENKPIRIAKQYIQNNYMKPIGLEEISEMVGFNLSYFSSLFKKETGKNFLEYLSEIRIGNAKELLRETNLSIAEICNRVGYSDIKHFNTIFKKYAGVKPGEFRKLYS